MTPEEILAPFTRGAELLKQADGTEEFHATIESLDVIEVLPDGRWWLLFREIGLRPRLWLITPPRIIEDAFAFTTEWGTRYHIGPVIRRETEERLANWWNNLPADAEATRASQRRGAVQEIADRIADQNAVRAL